MGRYANIRDTAKWPRLVQLAYLSCGADGKITSWFPCTVAAEEGTAMHEAASDGTGTERQV